MVEAFLVGGGPDAGWPVRRSLACVRPDDLAALVLQHAVTRAGLDPDGVDEVILGNANGAGEENRNVARMATLLAGCPPHPRHHRQPAVPSGLTRHHHGQPHDQGRCRGHRHRRRRGIHEPGPGCRRSPPRPSRSPATIFDTSIGWRFANPLFQKGELSRDGKMTYSMPETAEEVARVDNISREDADAFAVRSHERALAAIAAGGSRTRSSPSRSGPARARPWWTRTRAPAQAPPWRSSPD